MQYKPYQREEQRKKKRKFKFKLKASSTTYKRITISSKKKTGSIALRKVRSTQKGQVIYGFQSSGTLAKLTGPEILLAQVEDE